MAFDRSPVIRVQFTPTREEFIRTTAAVVRRARRLGDVLALVWILLALVALFTVLQFPWSLWSIVSVAFLIVAIALVLAGRMGGGARHVAEEIWNEHWTTQEPRVYEFGEERITHSTGSGQGEFAWSSVREATRVGGAIVLWVQGEAADVMEIHYVPESVLTDDQRADLSRLLEQKVPRLHRLPA